jgi:transaldolase
MLATTQLSRLGQSLWLDDITRELLDSGILARYIDQWSVTGLTSNSSIFDHAITHSAAYDGEIARLLDQGRQGEGLFFEIAIEDLRRAADLFLPLHKRTATVDGWVSLEVSPLLAHNTKGTVASGRELHAKAARPNLFIKIPGTREGLPAIEQAIFAGVPVNITLLFSPEQYLAAAEAYMHGLERRIEAGEPPDVRSVASLFISRWDRAVVGIALAGLQNRLGLAIGKAAYKAYRDLLDSDRWQRLANQGARAQRLLFASTSSKDPNASDVLYVSGLAAPNTVNTMPQPTLKATAEHAAISDTLLRDGGDGHEILGEFEKSGIAVTALAERLQDESADAFVQSWKDLLRAVGAKSKVLS